MLFSVVYYLFLLCLIYSVITKNRNIAQQYDRTVALRNNYIPLTQLLLRKLTRPFLREGGAGVRDYVIAHMTEEGRPVLLEIQGAREFILSSVTSLVKDEEVTLS